jgi:hypothetical protein
MPRSASATPMLPFSSPRKAVGARGVAKAPPLNVAGLFAGVGGVELGLRRAGHESHLLCEIVGLNRKASRDFQSAWAAFNAVAQSVDWERPTRGTNGSARDERRFEAMMLGVGAEPKRRAWSEALKLARVN